MTLLDLFAQGSLNFSRRCDEVKMTPKFLGQELLSCYTMLHHIEWLDAHSERELFERDKHYDYILGLLHLLRVYHNFDLDFTAFDKCVPLLRELKYVVEGRYKDVCELIRTSRLKITAPL
jgi:hypothetical protein